MAEAIDRVLGIDVDDDIVRAFVVVAGSPAVAGGYAQLPLDDAADAAAHASRLADALDAEGQLPVAVCFLDGADDDARSVVVAALSDAGHDIINVETRTVAIARTVAPDGTPEGLVGVDIPAGLLSSHPGLVALDLAAVAGVALSRLAPPNALTDEPITVWSPEPASEPAPAPVTAAGDPFTDDDLTVPASSDVRATLGIPLEMGDGGEDEDTELPAVSDVEDEDTELPAVSDVEDEDTGPARAAASALAPPAAVSTPSAARPLATDASANAPASGSEMASEDGGLGSGNRRLIPLLVGAFVVLAVAALALTQCGADDATVDVGSPASTPEPTGTVEATDEAADDGSVDPGEESPEGDDTSAAVEPEPSAETAPEPESAAEASPTAEPTAPPTPTVEPSPTPEPTPTASPTPEPTTDPIEDLPPLSSLPERGAVFRPPTLFLEGPVQTQEQADAFYAAAIAVVGPDNVVNNYVIRPDAPPAVDGNVRVEQAVLFATGSAVIADEFVPTLELGVAVMALNPQVEMVVEGHTDSVGSDEVNLALSQRRAEAVIDYLVGRGVDRTRLTALGLGESSPVASNDTADGRQINRRIEVELIDLLAPE